MTRQIRLCQSATIRAFASVALGMILFISLSVVLPIKHHSRAAYGKRAGLSFEERVAAQRAIEEVYWRHRIWPKENPRPKPSLDEVMPEEALRAKVEDYLRMSRALEVVWQRPITGEQLQAEMERMARQTKQPDLLRELWEALDNDPLVIAECLARPLLAKRLTRNWYASDERFHGELKQQAEAELSRAETVEQMGQISGEYHELEWRQGDGSISAAAAHCPAAGEAQVLDEEQWREQMSKLARMFSAVRREAVGSTVQRELINPQSAIRNPQSQELPVGRLSGLQEDETRFYTMAVVEKGADRLKVASVEWRKTSFDEWWSSVQGELSADASVSGAEFRLPVIEAVSADYSVAANSNAGSRTGTLIVAGQAFTVTQAGNNPVPTLTSLSPSSVTAGGSAFTLTVNGGNFITGSIVRWNGLDRTTTFVSGTQLTASISASDIAALGSTSVTVFNPAPGGGTSNTLSFTINPSNGDILLTSGVQFVGTLETAPSGACTVFLIPQYLIQAPAGATRLQLFIASNRNVQIYTRANNRIGVTSAGELLYDYRSVPVSQLGLIEITPTSPLPLQTGSYYIAVANCSTSSGSFGLTATVTVAGSCPLVSGINPNTGPIGGSVVITGSNLSGVSGVKFGGGVAANFTIDSSAQITATVPNGAMTGPIILSKQDCPDVQTDSFTITSGTQTGLLYVLINNTSGNQIYGYAVTEAIGALTLLPGFPISTGVSGDGVTLSKGLAIDRANYRLYAINRGDSDKVTAYAINPTTRALTPLPFSPINLDGGLWHSLVVHPSGSPLVIGDAVGRLLSYQITATTATAAAGSPYRTPGASPLSTAFSQDGNYVYTGGYFNIPPIAGFGVNAATGVLSALAGSPFNSGGDGPVAYATDAAGRLFVANQVARQVRVYTTMNGIPIPVSGNPFFSGLSEAYHGLLHPNGFYMVSDANRVGVYRIDGSGSTTTLDGVTGSPFAAGGSGTSLLALNQAGTFLFAANGLSRNLTTFSVNTTTGELTSLGTQPTDTLGTSGSLIGMAYLPPTSVPCPTITLSPAALPGGIVGTAYNQTISASPTGNYTFSVTAGALPAGLSLNSATGSLTGTPTTAGTANFTITALSVGPCSGSQSYALTIENPAPAVANIVPSSATAGGAGFTLTVNGSGFTNSSVVRWNGSDRPTTYASTTQLTAAIPAADIAQAGTANITVINPTPGGGVSGAVSLTIRQPNKPSLISSVTPNPVVAGGQSFTLTVNGSDFVSGSTVRWDGNDRPTTFVSATRLTAAIPAADVATAREVKIRVFTPDGGGLSNEVILTIANAVASVPAASFAGMTIAPDSIVAAFGTKLATAVKIATTTPLPTELEGTTVKVTDSAGAERLAWLFFVAPVQINYLMPAETAAGAATITVKSGDGTISVGTAMISPAAPSLFTANANGQGVAAGVALRVKADGAQVYEPIARFDSTQNRFVPEPIDLGNADEQVFLVLYGSGIRRRSALSAATATIGGLNHPVLFAGAVEGLFGLDQVNAGPLSRSLMGRGEVDLVLMVEGRQANTPRVGFK